jgi:hypothetical protein
MFFNCRITQARIYSVIVKEKYAVAAPILD